MKRFRRMFLNIFIILLLSGNVAVADTVDDLNAEMDYTELNEWMSRNGEGKSFTEYIEALLTGDEEFSAANLTLSIINSCFSGIEEELGLFSSMLLILGMAAVFSAFTGAIKNSHVAEVGFYLTYMLCVSLLIEVFNHVSEMAEGILLLLSEFMNLLTPAYIMGMAFCTGTSSATSMYEMSLILITLADGIVLKYIFPLIDIYMIMCIANHVSGKGMFTKLSELIFSVISWVNKSLLALIVGLSTVQSLVSPGVDQLKRSLLSRAGGMIPVVGNLVGGMTETVLGAGMVLKNVIGVAGVIAIAFLCLVPIAKILTVKFTIRFSSAMVEPVADSRMTEILSDTAKACGLVIQTLSLTACSFVLVIVILALGTGV